MYRRPGAGWQNIGDAWGGVLANGTYLQTSCCIKTQALLNAKTLTWTPTGSEKFDVPGANKVSDYPSAEFSISN
jgi:hypothetical protein